MSPFWRIKNAGDFLFNIRTPEQTVEAAAESVIREIVGQNSIDYVLTAGRTQVAAQARDKLQTLLDDYRAGVTITNVQLLRADPPEQVIDAFRDVQKAAADKDRLQKEAEAYARDVVPRARGEAAQLLEQAEAYKRRIVADASGDANRFNNVYSSYQVAKDVTQKRIYLETMEQVLRNANKVILGNNDGGSGVVRYLPLPEVQRRRLPQSDADSASGQTRSVQER